MGNVKRHFIKGRMNKSIDERLVPNGEYINALNVRLGSTEGSEVGSVENSKGNTQLTTLQYKGVDLSDSAQCIGSFEDGVNETIYWFIHDGANTTSSTGVVDMIVSYNTNSDLVVYHVVSTSILSFNPTFLITGVNKVEDLLFFTDDTNPPRKINVTRSYLEPTAGHVDQITEDDISVIKKPPRKAPTLQLIDVPGEENYLETNFISFSYRYKYIDNEYSALSQFTDVAFESSPFNLDPDTNFNDGMLNRYNTAVVGVNTGGEDVIGIDICFKLGNDSDVRVMRKYIKEEAGWPDGVVQTVNFTNQQIYTLLPSSEILRLYDNVPLVAQAQTVMGNRLMYGNYEDGYDLTTATGGRIDTNYTTDLISENISTSLSLGSRANGVDYTIDIANTVTATNADAVIDFSSVGEPLEAGGVFAFGFTVSHQGFSGSGQASTPITVNHPTFTISFVFNLPQDYNSIFQMVNSAEFIAQLGSNLGGSFQPVSNCSSGSTFTDIYNCSMLPPSGYSLINTGVTAGSQGVFLSSDSNTPDIFSVQILAAQYNNTSTSNNQYFEYFNVSNVTFTYQTESSNKSLHSNRDYEVGIVYMDKYKRATTTLTSSENTVFVSPVNSSTINRIRTTIPINMTAPSWADTYKFVLKQSRGAYDTIYSTTYYYDASTTSYWFRLVGQDQALVQAGTELIVKTDANGTVANEVKVTVLDKVSQPTNFLHLLQNSSDILEVPGLYMRLRAQDFSIDTESNNTCYPTISHSAQLAFFGSNVISTNTTGSLYGQAVVNYPCFTTSGASYTRISVPMGAVVRIKIKFRRDNLGLCGGNIGAHFCRVTKTFTASQTYTDIKAFWDGEGLGSIIPNSMNCEVECQDEDGPNQNVYEAGEFSTTAGSSDEMVSRSLGTNQMFFYSISDDPATEANKRLYLRCVNGSETRSPGVATVSSITKVEICIQEPGSLVVFETVPNEIADGVFFEGSENYDIVGGYHQGNIVNQDATTEGVVELDFFNCYAFGNGVESYKIEDSSIGQSFALGERTILVSAQDFKRADRFADITYSGVYNDESNVNKLNEFNLGLLNFKTLEDVYGPVQKMVARETDILVLQEDRISYVLTNKDAITDAKGGNILTAAPLILGQQVARVEEYGISANPESYAEFGMDKYFTDAKRGSVIQLRGSSFSNEQLTVVSQAGMRSYFRDLFNAKFNTQKLGGYDPYMDEYVVSSNENKLPVETACVNCDISQTINLAADGDTSEFCVNLGGVVGDVVIEWNTPILGAGANFDIVAVYDGTTYNDLGNTSSGTITINKNSVNPNTVAIVVTANGGSVNNLNFTVNCPVGNELKIIQVALNLNWQQAKTIHNEFRFVDGTTESNTYNQGVIFGTGTEPVVSQYQELTGLQGTTVFPPNGSTVYVQVRKQSGDTFNYDPTASSANKLQYLRSNTLYENNPTDIAALLSASSSNVLSVTPNTLGSLLYTGDFTMPNNSNDYLYLIYDYRLAQSAELCSGATSAGACCSCGALTTFYLDSSNLSSATSVYADEGLTTLAPNQFYSQLVNGNNIVRQQSAGVLLPATSCASCDRKCTDPDPVPAPTTPALSPRQVYDITYDLASGVGVVPIRFTPGGGTGIFATYNNVVTSDSSATNLLNTQNPAHSYFEGPYYGDDSVCNPPTGINILPLYNWDEINEDFDNSSTTVPINIQASALTSLTTGGAGSYVLYVSKQNATPSTMDLRIVSACSTGVPNWSVDVDCPRILTGFASSAKASTEVDICNSIINSTLYNLPVTNPNAFGIPAVRDWVFSDNLGQSLAEDGYYKLSGGSIGCTYIRVVNGVIASKTN